MIQVAVKDELLKKMLIKISKRTEDLSPMLGRLGLWLIRDSRERLRARPRDADSFRSGALGKSMTMAVEPRKVEVGSNLVYARIQQLGGTIVPKTVKRLAIPLQPHLKKRHIWPRDLTRDGVKMFVLKANGKAFLATLEEEKKSSKPRGSATKRLFKALGKKHDTAMEAVGLRKGRKARAPKAKAPKLRLLYLLVSKVTIKARPFIVWSDEARDFLMAQIKGALLR